MAQITFDPHDISDTRSALRLAALSQGLGLAEWLSTITFLSDPDADTSDTSAPLVRLCQRMLDPARYGETRRGLVRVIAEGSPAEVPRETLYAAANAIDSTKNSGQVVGGLHGNLEQTWRSLGGPGAFVTTTPTGFTMRVDLAEVVLAVLNAG